MLKVVEEYRGVTWPDSVTVPLEPGVTPCRGLHTTSSQGICKRGYILKPAALPPAMIVIVLPLDEVIATGCEPFRQTTFEGLCSI